MILGDVCTRACGFCSVKTGKLKWDDPLEPIRTAIAIKKMQLRHVVITSVDRDDLKDDYGSSIWGETINQIREHVPGCTVEVLTPDFKGYRPALERVFNTRPDIFSHNVECVERISRKVRSQAIWERSIDILRQSAEFGLYTKTGIMVGLGENFDEVVNTMQEIKKSGVSIFTIGQYLQPSPLHHPVYRFVPPSKFADYRQLAIDKGFLLVSASPLTRSSYHADSDFVALKAARIAANS